MNKTPTHTVILNKDGVIIGTLFNPEVPIPVTVPETVSKGYTHPFLNINQGE